MRSLIIIGFAVGIPLAGCASTSSPSEPATSPAVVPALQHTHGDGTQARMMAEMCPMQLSGTTVTATDVTGGIGLSFVTTTGDVSELRQRVLRMADAHNQPRSHTNMGSHGAQPGAVHEDGGRGGKMMGGGMMGGGVTGGGETSGGMTGGGMMMGGGMNVPAATASSENMEGGARLILQPKDPAQLEALREHVRMKAQRMAQGECPMMSQVNVGERAPGTPGDGTTTPPGAP